MKPFVSCIIPTFNRAELLKDAIKSTLKQTYENWELIIVDDHSADQTEEVVRRFQDKEPRIRYFKNPRKGGSAARNHGLSVARGDYIAFLDDDDVHLPHRFEAQIKAMQRGGSRFLVSGYREKDRETKEVLKEEKMELKVKGAGFPSRWMIKKELLTKVGGFDEAFPSMQDIELSYKLSRHETYALHNDIVSVLYATSGSVSRVRANRLKGRLMLLKKNEHHMPRLEAAWWYFMTAIDCYYLGDTPNAIKQLRKAADLDDRGIYTWAKAYFLRVHPGNQLLRKANLKLLKLMRDFRFPATEEHQVVDLKGEDGQVQYKELKAKTVF